MTQRKQALEEISRREFEACAESPGYEEIQTGALQRIAIADERLADRVAPKWSCMKITMWMNLPKNITWELYGRGIITMGDLSDHLKRQTLRGQECEEELTLIPGIGAVWAGKLFQGLQGCRRLLELT